ncbi:fructosamine kinase family protein [Gracilibacillus kekensis]|uniref:Fructosamine-3-kinase n=1 Tax=Gracilibacillus kekensis TaxID=1027249 RepID=A0A1M7KFV3_9BACI|nr:fructosamine kinase family protein [Gracilibacillus kekensis]SHM63955.1 Fructosamine-3-kinase [Gracilibacillus kekensis]
MEDKLRSIGDYSKIKMIQSVSGGDINQAYFVETAEQTYFIKTNKQVPADFFQVEAEGLDRIRDTKTIHVPEVFHYDIAHNDEEIYLLMEWVEGEKHTSTGKWLGEDLAALHSTHVGKQYGLDSSTFVGEIRQENLLFDNWLDYYREQRLQPQMNLAISKGRMSGKRLERMEQLLSRLDQYIPSKPRVSLLHGDLWGGNWLAGLKGTPYLIDPSIVYGDPLFEIAFTELFGGFPGEFYASYQSILPLADYYEDIKPLYQLFYLMVHLNLFGEGYGTSVDRILKHYTV